MTLSTCAVVRSFIESKTTEVQDSNVGFTSEVSDYLVVHTGPGGVIHVESMVLKCLHCQVPDGIRSAVGLVGPWSVYG